MRFAILRPALVVIALGASLAVPGNAGVTRDRLPADAEFVDPGTGKGSPRVVVATADGVLHLLYHGEEQSLRYARREGAGWKAEVVDPRYGFSGFQPMVVDALGRVHAAFVSFGEDWVNDRTVMYGRREAGGWALEEIAPGGAKFFSPCLFLGADDHPRIVFESAEGMQIASFDGESWTVEPFGPPPPDSIRPLLLFRDAEGRFHALASLDIPQAWMQVYATDASGSWERESIWSDALALDPSGNPHLIALADSGVPDARDRMVHRWFDGAEWRSEEMLDSGVPFRRRQPTAALVDSAGRLSVAFRQIDEFPDARTERVHWAFRDELGWRDLRLGRPGAFFPNASVGADDAVHISWLGDHARIAFPDLAVDAAELEVEAAGNGVRVSGPLFVRNAGPGRSHAARVRFFLSDDDSLDEGDEPFGSPRSVPSLRPGKAARIPLDLRIPGPVARKRLLAVVRPAGRMPDLDRANDAAAIPLGE